MKLIAAVMMIGVLSTSAFAGGYQCEVIASKKDTVSCEGTMILEDPDSGLLGSHAWLPCESRFNASQIVMLKDQLGYTVILKVAKNEYRTIGQSLISLEGEKPSKFSMQYETEVDTVQVTCKWGF